MINRKYFSSLLSACKEVPAVGVIGIRQVGKTTLVKQLLSHLPNDYIYLDLERPSDQNKLQDPELFFTSQKGKSFILDEIQTKPGLFPLLRSLIDEDKRAGKFIILGSASPALLRQSSESLAGRIRYIELPPLQLIELEGSDLSQEDHWLKGGLPDSVLKGNGQSIKWRQDYLKTIVERDLPQLGFPVQSRNTYRLLSMLAHNQGQLWNGSQLSKSLEISHTTLKSYRDFLEGAFLIRTLQPWWQNAKKRMIKSPKVYIRDSGLLHSILQIHSLEDLFAHPVVGFSWEGYVIDQIINALPIGYEAYFANSSNQAEIDLFIAKANKPIMSIEIKLTDSPKVPKGFTNLSEDFKIAQRYIVTPKADRYPIRSKVLIIGLKAFLAELNSANFS